jgi:hypothetical protein
MKVGVGMKKNRWLGVALAVGISFALPAWSFPWSSSCEEAADKPKPDWIRDGYGEADLYVGVGSSSKSDKTERQAESEALATQHLTEHIEVKINSVNEQSTSVSNQRVQKDALSKVTVSAEEVLRGLHIKDRWMDKESCTLYTLIVTSKKEVALAKREKAMKNLLDSFKALLGEGTNRNKNPDLSDRRKTLEEAQEILAGIEFNLLPEVGEGKSFYKKQLDDAFAAIVKESSQSTGRMALFVLNKDHHLKDGIIGKMVEQLQTVDPSTVRLMENCDQEDDCKKIAKQHGFTKLTMLFANCQVGVSQMGSLKGKLTATKKIYDLDSRKILVVSNPVTAEVIGWSNEELDWSAAAEKVMLGLK